MCALCGDIQRGGKRDSDDPELELPVVVASDVSAGNELRSSEEQALSITEPFLQLH